MSLSPEQSRFLEALIARYTKRTAGSKKLASENRPLVADPRSASGFKQLWKEMVYPLYTNRSDGSKVWDVDGNEYVDFVMGFGASMFGHRPPFVVRAMHEQLDLGFEIGPIHPLAGEVAALIREFTGMQRVGFTNTGSEAVLAATRIARTVTGRDKIAVFAGAYHGIFDEVLFRPLTVNGETRTAPIAPGIPGSALSEVIVLDYGNPESLDVLRARGSEIAAVLVEPVQSRRLDLQPREFMHQLRRVTQEIGSALIFDEVVTGFRVEPGGAQAHFGVRADIATYGKVIGGGVSIGVVAGDPKYMDALDGGHWQYGDTSFPEVGVTFFAGTFVRHPLALAAAKAVLTHLKESGPELQRNLTGRTERLANQMRAILEEFQAPYILTQFSSLIQLTYPAEQKFAGLLFYLLRERGIHIWENRAFVITTAHDEEDLTRLTTALRGSLTEMNSAGFFGHAAPRTIGTSAHTGTFPLTEAQKEIWLAAQMGGDAAVAYNESLKLDFRGAFDVDTFRTALRRVVERHPILFATFSADGQSQTVVLGATIEVPLLDLTGKDESEREQALEGVIQEETSQPFDLGIGPLLRVRIVRLAAEHHVVVWTAHHIVCDGWSAGLLINELAKVYSALRTGTEPNLDAPLSFQEYAAANRSDSPQAVDAVEYWRQQFAELPPPLDLPADRPRPAVRSARAATLERTFDASLTQALKQTAGRQRTTLVVLLMTALKTLLNRLSGETDLVVGLGVAGQAVTGKDCLVGHCVNLLPVRTRIQPDASFQHNLMTVKTNVLDAYDHHASTIGELLQHLRVARSPGRSPLVEVIFNLDRDPGSVEFHGLHFSCGRNPKRALHFDLFFNFVESPQGLRIECDFNTDIFDETTLQRWLTHYQTLVEGIVADPTQTLGSLPILTPAQRDELVNTPGNSLQFPKSETLHEWFERQVEATPDARAVTFDSAHLTYRELNRRANQVAHYLKTLGVGPEVLVGLFVERSFEMVVGILGILKAGGAYLPIDPVYPKDRIAFMLDDANVPVVLTHSKLVPELGFHKAQFVALDSDSGLFDNLPDSNIEASSTPDNLAYVIYTSGSTGKPKGSLVTHYNVVRLMQSTQPWYGFHERDVWTLFHSHAFDFSVWEMWGALLNGGRLVVISYLTSRSPRDFYELLVAEQVTVLNQTPSAFRQLMQVQPTQESDKGLALRYVIFGGEALEMESLEPWFKRNGDQKPQLVNMYGITETTVHVTYRPLQIADLKASSVVGVPIPDLQVYILDSYGNPVPIGVKGEIYVGGAGVARGYLNREELTRERFVPDRFTNRSGALLYRSGDLARYLPNRDIEYLGRIDDQIKIRGFRIELGEVEAALSRHPSVAQCVVVAREVVRGDKRLVAYCRPTAGQELSIAGLRDHLKKDLPDYMIPSSFMIVEEFRLTAHGKIDRKALPAPSENQLAAQTDFAAPRDAIEQMLCQLWSRILRIKRVGLRDNFFELGGHSLLAVRIVVEIEKLFHKRLPLATLLQAPTIAQLSGVLREHWVPSWSSLVPIRPGGSKPPLFLIHSHGGNVLEYYPVANLLDNDQPVYALQARGLDGRISENQTIEEMAEAYIAEIKSLQPHGPYFLGGFCFGGLVALEAAQQLTASGEAVGLLVLIQTVHPTANQFAPGMTGTQKLWQRAAKRISLEREILAYRGPVSIKDRLRRAWDIGLSKMFLALDSHKRKADAPRRKLPMRVILESLGIQHDKAYQHYRPRPYAGDVVLLRAAKQLPGLREDPQLGWKGILRGHLEIAEIPGHQQNMMIQPHVVQLAAELEARLQGAQIRSEQGEMDGLREHSAEPEKSMSLV